MHDYSTFMDNFLGYKEHTMEKFAWQTIIGT